MSVTVIVEPHPGHLQATISGEYAYEEFASAVRQVMDAAHEYRLAKMLVDCRGITGEPTYAERFALGQFLGDQLLRALAEGRSVDYQLAAVATPPFAHPEQISLKPLVERGLKVRVCATVDEALVWLEV